MNVSCDADRCMRLGVQTVTASQVQYFVKLFVIPARTFQRRYNAKHQPSRQYRELSSVSIEWQTCLLRLGLSWKP